MRVAIVTESFLPQVNGVSNTVRHIVDELVDGRPRGAGRRTRTRARPARRGAGGPGPVGRPARLPVVPDRAARRRRRPQPRPLRSRRRAPRLARSRSARSGCAPRAGSASRPSRSTRPTSPGFARQYGLRADAVVDRWVGRLHRRVDRTLVPSTRLAGPARGARRPRPAPLAARHRPRPLRPGAPQPAPAPASWTDGAPDRRRVRRPAGAREAGAPARRCWRGLPGVQLVVIGDGPARAELERQLPGRGLHRDAAAAPTSRRRSPPSTSSCTPATPRPSARPIQEAQASGVPVVAPAAGGPLDLVEPGRTGLLFDPDRPRARCATAWRCCATRPALRRDLADQAPLAVAGRSWASVVDELVDLHYRACWSLRQRPPPERRAGRPARELRRADVGRDEARRGRARRRVRRVRRRAAPGHPGLARRALLDRRR